VPSTSKFHFSKGKYGNVVLAWHGALIQKAKANFADICVQARKIFGVADIGIGSDNQQAQNANPEVRTRVGLDSESESEGESRDVDYHGNDGSSDDKDDGKNHNDDRKEAELSLSELDVIHAVVEKDGGGEETEVDAGPSCLGGRHGTTGKARSRK
jgi:hypothetical protein